MSQSEKFAELRARTMTFAPRKPVVIVMDFDEENAEKNLNIRHFDSITDEWKFFVAINRAGLENFSVMNSFFPDQLHNLDYKYDVVVDIPADAGISVITDQMDCILDDVNHLNKPFEECKKDILKLIHSINEGNVDPAAKQFSFHTVRSLKYLRYTRIIENV